MSPAPLIVALAGLAMSAAPVASEATTQSLSIDRLYCEQIARGDGALKPFSIRPGLDFEHANRSVVVVAPAQFDALRARIEAEGRWIADVEATIDRSGFKITCYRGVSAVAAYFMPDAGMANITTVLMDYLQADGVGAPAWMAALRDWLR